MREQRVISVITSIKDQTPNAKGQNYIIIIIIIMYLYYALSLEDNNYNGYYVQRPISRYIIILYCILWKLNKTADTDNVVIAAIRVAYVYNILYLFSQETRMSN